MSIIETIRSGLSATVPMWLYVGTLTVLTVNNLALQIELRNRNKARY